MKVHYLFIFFVLLAIALFGCSERDSKEEHKEVKPALERAYKITFSLSGDDFASRQDLATISSIKVQLVDKRIAEVLSTGSGMGYMTIIFRLNRDNSLNSIKNVVQEVYPEAAYRIEPVEISGSGLEK